MKISRTPLRAELKFGLRVVHSLRLCIRLPSPSLANLETLAHHLGDQRDQADLVEYLLALLVQQAYSCSPPFLSWANVFNPKHNWARICGRSNRSSSR